jgi:hypothetical protein
MFTVVMFLSVMIFFKLLLLLTDAANLPSSSFPVFKDLSYFTTNALFNAVSPSVILAVFRENCQPILIPF